jgi:FHA domain-containing protein
MDNSLQPIIASYTQLRGKGMDSKGALEALRPKIEPLAVAQRQELAQLIRSWEVTNTFLAAKPPPVAAAPAPESKAAPAPSLTQIKAVKTIAAPPKPADESSKLKRPEATTPIPQPMDAMTCPHCGKPNAQGDVLCYSCGQLLENVGTYETHKLAETDDHFHREDYFGVDSTLVLVTGGNQKSYKIRPQEKARDFIVGRDAGETMKPDLDLNEHQADSMGVSRLHISLRYSVKHDTVCVCDMGSANGTFINGQRLHPNEVRVLRHGDELKLGRLPLKVFFHHPENGAVR